MDSCYRCYGMTTSRCDMTTSHSSHHGMPVAKHGPTKVPKGVHFQLDLPDAKPQGYDLRLRLDGCGDVPYCPHCPSLHKVADGEVVDDMADDADSADTDTPIPNSMDSSNPNSTTTTSCSDMDYSNSRTDRSNHSTSHTMAQPLRPTSQTSR